jgi:hypothetical protein
MDFAIRASDGKRVYAEDSLDTKESPYGFYCPYAKCGVELMLKSYTSQNLKAPYFAPKSEPHTSECAIFHSNSSSGSTSGIDNSIPLPYKNKLILENESSSKNLSNKVFSDKSEEEDGRTQESFHNRTARHLAPIVRWYLQNPSKGDLGLEVPGCYYKKYRSIFQKIYTSPQKEYKDTHIFFGQLLFKNYFEEQKNQLVFNLYQYNSAESLQLKLFTKDWGDSSKKSVIDLAREAVEKSNEAYKNGIKNVRPYVFFLGYADNETRRTFYCNKEAAFYALAIKDLELSPANCGIYTSPSPRSSQKEVLDLDLQLMVDSSIDERTTDLGKFESSDNDDLSIWSLSENFNEPTPRKTPQASLGMDDGTEVQSESERKKGQKLSVSERIKSFFMSLIGR